MRKEKMYIGKERMYKEMCEEIIKKIKKAYEDCNEEDIKAGLDVALRCIAEVTFEYFTKNKSI